MSSIRRSDLPSSARPGAALVGLVGAVFLTCTVIWGGAGWADVGVGLGVGLLAGALCFQVMLTRYGRIALRPTEQPRLLWRTALFRALAGLWDGVLFLLVPVLLFGGMAGAIVLMWHISRWHPGQPSLVSELAAHGAPNPVTFPLEAAEVYLAGFLGGHSLWLLYRYYRLPE